MTRRINIVRSSLLVVAIAAVPAFAGPLSVSVLKPMRERTMQKITAAQDAIKLLNQAMEKVNADFAAATSTGTKFADGEYEGLLGRYFQRIAEYSADLYANEAYIASLSEHLSGIDAQLEAWGETGKQNGNSGKFMRADVAQIAPSETPVQPVIMAAPITADYAADRVDRDGSGLFITNSVARSVPAGTLKGSMSDDAQPSEMPVEANSQDFPDDGFLPLGSGGPAPIG